MWKPSPGRHVLKALRESPKEKVQKGQYQLAVDLGCYKWYQSQTPDNVRQCVILLAVLKVSSFSLFPRGVDTRRCASKDAGPKGRVDLGTIPHQLEEGKSSSVSLGPEGGWIVISHIGWGGEQITIYKGVETFP